MNILYSLEKITFRYDGGFTLFVDGLHIPQGEMFGLMGANGSGKSSLLRLLGFLETPDSGTLYWKDTPVEKADTGILRKQVTLLGQSPYLLKRSVEENLAYGLRLRNDTANLHQRLCAALTLVGLPETYLRKHAYALSGGEAKRVALAARLLLNPDVLLLDEPTAEVDSESSERITEILHQLRRQQVTVIVASHDRQWLEQMTDVNVLLENGRIISSSASQKKIMSNILYFSNGSPE